MNCNLFLFLCTVLFAAIKGFAQQEDSFDAIKKKIQLSTYYDSAQVFQLGEKAIEIARKEKSLSKEAEILQYYGNYFYFSQQKKSAKEWYQKSMKLASKEKNRTLENSTKIRMAFIMIDEGEEEFSESVFKQILKESEQRKDFKNQVESLNGLGLLYESRGLSSDALNYYLEGIRVAEKSNQKYYEAMLLNNLGLLHYRNNQRKQALDEFERALKVAEEEKEYRLAINLLINMGLSYMDDKDEKKALEHYKKSLSYAKKLGFPTAVGVSYLNLGSVFYNLKDYDNALAYYDSSGVLFETSNNNEFVSKSILAKARAYLAQNKFPETEKFTKEGLEVAHKNNVTEDIILAEILLSELYEKTGNYKLSLEHLKNNYRLKDSIDNLKNKEIMAELEVRYDVEKKENALIKEKSRATELEKENLKRRSRNRIILGASAFILIIGIGGLYVRHIRITRKQQQEFSGKLIENIEKERSRISKDLHDDIGQSLSVVKSKVHLFNQGQTQSLEGLEETVGDVIEQTRQISRNLYPSYLEKIGLARSVASMLDKVQRDTNVVCSFEISEAAEKLELDKKTHLYRILQECVNNTLKHSGATALKISIEKENELLKMTYQDNGKGISKQEFSSGMGFMSIRERVRIINGILNLDDKAEKGFKLSLKF
jgi:two-component system, NarL family, sensor kinase